MKAAMVLIADGSADGSGDQAIIAADGRSLQRAPWSRAAAILDATAVTPTLVIEAEGVSDAVLDEVLPAIGRYLATTGAAAVVALSVEQIDIVARHLLSERAQLLCGATLAERTAAVRSATTSARPTLHDSTPKRVETERTPFDHGSPRTEHELLRRLTDGVAQIRRYADDLIGSPAPAVPLELADRRKDFRAAQVTPTHVVHARDVRRVIFHRQQRAKFFGGFSGEALFEDPAWDMLLDLYAAELEGTQVSVSSLCIAAGVAPTTALRWIAKMTSLDLFIRHPDPVDRRRAFMALSPQASSAMRSYMTAIHKADLAG